MQITDASQSNGSPTGSRLLQRTLGRPARGGLADRAINGIHARKKRIVCVRNPVRHPPHKFPARRNFATLRSHARALKYETQVSELLNVRRIRVGALTLLQRLKRAIYDVRESSCHATKVVAA